MNRKFINLTWGILIFGILNIFLFNGCNIYPDIKFPPEVSFTQIPQSDFSFSGEWETSWGTLNFYQDGTKLKGEGISDKMEFSGKVTGNHLVAHFYYITKTFESGSVNLYLSHNGLYFKGTYFSNQGTGIWNGRKLGPATPIK